MTERVPDRPVISSALIYYSRLRGNVDEVQHMMVCAVVECLSDRGYREIVSDKAEERQLRKLKGVRRGRGICMR